MPNSVNQRKKSRFNDMFVPLLLAAMTSSVMAPAHANDRQVPVTRFTEFAPVIDVKPVYQNIRANRPHVSEPQTECWIETQQQIIGYQPPRYPHHRPYRHRKGHSANSAIVGGIIGGVIGNQLGRKHSSNTRSGATIAGVIIGGAVGNEANARHLKHQRHQSSKHRGAPIYQSVEVERCRKVPRPPLTQRLQHYDVTYRYNGRIYTTRTKRDPGRQIELQVSVSPARPARR